MLFVVRMGHSIVCVFVSCFGGSVLHVFIMTFPDLLSTAANKTAWRRTSASSVLRSPWPDDLKVEGLSDE